MAFVKFQLSDIRAAVKDKLDDQDFPDATIDRAANDFQFELFNDNAFRFMEENTTLSVGAGATSKTLPDDFMRVITLILINSTQFTDITKNGMNYEQFMNAFANFSVAPAARISSWTLFGEAIRFQSPTDKGYDLNLDYLRSPALMTDATSYCELPISARELMTLGTLERVMRINEDYNESDAEWDRLQSLRTSFIRNWARGSGVVGPQVIKTNRGVRKGDYRVDRDF